MALQKHHGGNFGRIKRVVVIQKSNGLNYNYMIYKQNMIQAVTIIILT